MREIKFRGKPIGEIEKLIKAGVPCENGWVHGNLITNNGKPFIVGEVVEADIDYIAIEWWVKVHPESVGQYTGIDCDNGDKIYDGDIIKSTPTSPCGKGFIGVVNYDECRYWLDNGLPYIPLFTEANKLEKLGTIFENPKLLESGE